MSRSSHLVMLAAFACASLHCASIRPRAMYTAFGKADPEKDEEVVSSYREHLAAVAPDDVVVLVDTVPEGLEISHDNITVKEGYSHQLVGKFELAPNFGASMTGLFWFADYESGWRKPYCYPQVVFNWVTLTLWSELVPLSYPCWGSASFSKSTAIKEAKALARAAGGDLVILGYLGSAYSSDPNDIFGSAGFILKVDPRMKSGELKTAPAELHPAPKTM